MTEKELKKLNRYQLLELLIMQTERADQLQARLEETEKKLEEQTIKISSLGSIAEASMELHGLFQSAQEAADMYVNAAKKRAEEIEENAYQKGADILAQALKESYRVKDE